MKTTSTILLFIGWCFSGLAQNNQPLQSTVCESFVGTAYNQLAMAWGPKTNLWYDKDVDVLTFVFSYDSLNIGYAYSLDQGLTWTLDTMLYQAPSAIYGGRHPQGLIYNPAGNTNPSNAYVTCFGTTNTTNAHYEGTAAIGSGTNQQTIYPFTSYPPTFVPQGGTIVKNTGDTWWSAAGSSGNSYNDTVILAKGTYGGGNFSYTYQSLPVAVCTDNNGDKMFRNQAVIFDDNGLNGYVVVIGNDVACFGGDSAMQLLIFNTQDGGNTWFQQQSPDLNFAGVLLPVNAGHYTASNRLDLAMDQNGTLHIALAVIPYSPGNAIINTYQNLTWGLFDVSTTAFGYSICLIATPEQYYGEFTGIGPTLYEDNRVQLSRNWDGTKIFYTWFDTDTMIYGTIGNNFPDMHAVGYDVQTNLYSNEFNFTEFSGVNADGSTLFGNVSYYTINDGLNENIPVIFDLMGAGLQQPINFFYLGCTAVTSYTNGGNCIVINHIGNPNGGQVNLLECTVYPNPFTQNVFIDLALNKTFTVTIEISNALGQVMATVSYPDLPPGKNTLKVDGSGLGSGVYFFTVKSGSETVTKLIGVE